LAGGLFHFVQVSAHVASGSAPRRCVTDAASLPSVHGAQGRFNLMALPREVVL
jgi:hypothetical protein